jgi:hypothetical protein
MGSATGFARGMVTLTELSEEGAFIMAAQLKARWKAKEYPPDARTVTARPSGDERSPAANLPDSR